MKINVSYENRILYLLEILPLRILFIKKFPKSHVKDALESLGFRIMGVGIAQGGPG